MSSDIFNSYQEVNGSLYVMINNGFCRNILAFIKTSFSINHLPTSTKNFIASKWLLYYWTSLHLFNEIVNYFKVTDDQFQFRFRLEWKKTALTQIVTGTLDVKSSWLFQSYMWQTSLKSIKWWRKFRSFYSISKIQSIFICNNQQQIFLIYM